MIELHERRALLERILSRKLGLSPKRIPEDDPNGLPTAYCERDRNYYNDLLDDIGTRDVLGVIR